MRKVALIIITLATVFLGGVGYAETIAVLDANLIMNESNAAKKAIGEINAARDAARKKVEALEAPLQKEQKELENKRSALSREEFAEKQGDLRKKIMQYRSEAQNLQEELDRKYLGHRQRILDAMSGIVTKMAQEKKYDIVIPKNVLFYNVNSVDITADVLKRVNAEVK